MEISISICTRRGFAEKKIIIKIKEIIERKLSCLFDTNEYVKGLLVLA